MSDSKTGKTSSDDKGDQGISGLLCTITLALPVDNDSMPTTDDCKKLMDLAVALRQYSNTATAESDFQNSLTMLRRSVGHMATDMALRARRIVDAVLFCGTHPIQSMIYSSSVVVSFLLSCLPLLSLQFVLCLLPLSITAGRPPRTSCRPKYHNVNLFFVFVFETSCFLYATCAQKMAGVATHPSLAKAMMPKPSVTQSVTQGDKCGSKCACTGCCSGKNGVASGSCSCGPKCACTCGCAGSKIPVVTTAQLAAENKLATTCGADAPRESKDSPTSTPPAPTPSASPFAPPAPEPTPTPATLITESSAQIHEHHAPPPFANSTSETQASQSKCCGHDEQ
jgi:hypothetical protein